MSSRLLATVTVRVQIKRYEPVGMIPCTMCNGAGVHRNYNSGVWAERDCFRCHGRKEIDGGKRAVNDHEEIVTVEVTGDTGALWKEMAESAARNRSGRASKDAGRFVAKVKTRERVLAEVDGVTKAILTAGRVA